MSSASTAPLSLLLQQLRSTASQLTVKPLYAPHQAEYAAAVQLIESHVLAMSEVAWRAANSDGTVSDVIGCAIGSVSCDDLSAVAVQAWLDTMDALLVRVKPAANPTHLVPQLWDTATRMAKDRESESGTLTAVLRLLRIILLRRPMSIECVPRQHLPHPAKTVGIAPRLAALELLPLLVLNQRRQPQPYYNQQKQQQQRQKQQPSERGINCNPQKVLLASSWFEYLRKAITCPILAVRGKAVEALCVLLREGLLPDATQITNLLNLLMRLAEGGEMSPKLQRDLGAAVGGLMALSQRGAGWGHFAATNASDSARIIASVFHSATMTRFTQRLLSIAIGELLLLAASPTSVDEAIVCVFGLLLPVRYDERMYMPPIVSRAVRHWASLVGSDIVRVAIVRSLARFLDTSSGKIATHTALLCLADVLLTTVATSEFDMLLWTQLLLVPQRHPTLAQAASEAAASLAQRSEMCGRTLLRELYTACGEIEPDKVLLPSFTLRVKVLLAMPSVFLRRPAVLETLLAIVVSLSIDTPPPRVERVFLRHVTYFNRLALLLLTHQRERLADAIIANIKTSVRVFLSLLVSNPSVSPLYGRAASSACAVLVELGAGDLELKLVVAMLEAVEATGGVVGMQLRAAAYTLLGGALWSVCSDDVGKRGVLVQALADVAGAIRRGVPCAASSVEGEKDDVLLLPLLLPPQVSSAVLTDCLDDRQRLVPGVSQKAQAHVAYCAVQSILGSCANSEWVCLQRVFDSLTEWRNINDGDVAVTAWNVLCCLDVMFANCNGEYMREATTPLADEWFTFVVDHWLSSDVWVVRLLAARVLARLAVPTGRRDAFTSNAVKKFDLNADTCRLSGTLLALGAIHSDNVTPTASMAISFVTRVLKQQCGLRGDTTVVAAALLALIRMAPKHEQLIKLTVSTTLMPQLLVPMPVTPLEPIVSSLLLTLSSMLSLHVPPQQDEGIIVCVRELVYSAASCESLSAGGISSMLREVRRNVKDLWQVVETHADIGDASTTIVDITIVKRRVLKLLEDAKGRLGDEVSREIANVLDACSCINSFDTNNVSLLHVASMIDTAGSDETRSAWMNLARTIVFHACCDGYRHLGTCIQQMELVVRGKPARQGEEREENVRIDAISNDTHEDEGKWLSLGDHKKRGTGAAGIGVGVGTVKGETSVVVTSEVASKVAILTLMTEILQKQLQLQQEYEEGIRPDIPAVIDDEMRTSLLRVLLAAASLAEVMPCMISCAVSGLQAAVLLYGGRAGDTTLTAPPLHQWRVLLVNALQSVISRAVFCCDAACTLAETFLVCGVADDSGVRRVSSALTLLLTALDASDADAVAARTSVSVSTAVRHGGCGRVLIALAAFTGRCPSAAATIASASGQAAAALMCNQVTTSIALANGYEPAHDMVSAPLDDCAHATPAAVLEVLSCMCAVVDSLGPTVRHAAGCLVCLLLCMRCVPLRPMLSIVPLLSTKHHEIVWDVALKLLHGEPPPRVSVEEHAVLGYKALSDADAGDVLEIAAATTCEKSAEQVESILATIAAYHRCSLGSLSVLRLAMQASCRVGCIEDLLRHVSVEAVLTCEDKIIASMAQYVQKLSSVEQQHLAFSSSSGLLLMLLLPPADDDNALEVLIGPTLTESVMVRLAEALAQTEEPLLLLQRVFSGSRASMRVCGILLALFLSVRSPALQQRWSPCLEYVLLSIIHGEALQRETHGPKVLERVALFVRGVLLLLSTATAETVRSRHPNACAALTKQLLQENANELREVIQSLSAGEAAALRKLMQLQESDNSAVAQRRPDEYHSSNEVQPQGRVTAIPQRLTINLVSYTKA